MDLQTNLNIIHSLTLSNTHYQIEIDAFKQLKPSYVLIIYFYNYLHFQTFRGLMYYTSDPNVISIIHQLC